MTEILLVIAALAATVLLVIYSAHRRLAHILEKARADSNSVGVFHYKGGWYSHDRFVLYRAEMWEDADRSELERRIADKEKKLPDAKHKSFEKAELDALRYALSQKE